MSDPKLVEAVLGEEWRVGTRAAHAEHTIRLTGKMVIVGCGTVPIANERARQAALGHRALKWLVAYVDGDLYPDAAASIVAELRGGK